jgi:hypothetical protein
MEMSTIIRERTPIEGYLINGVKVRVKREDLFAGKPAPPLGKLRGMRLLLDKFAAAKVPFVGCWDTRVSQLGLGLAAFCRNLPDLNAVVSYPTKQNSPTPAHIIEAEKLGAEIYPVKGTRINICFAEARRYVESLGGVMLPFGLECAEAVEAVAREAATVPARFLDGGTLILSCGSGVTLAGLLRGLPVLPRRVVGISSGRSLSNINRCLTRYLPEIPEAVELREAGAAYSQALTYPCPFAAHPHYDLKAWKFLIENLDDFPRPILFWNIGALLVI